MLYKNLKSLDPWQCFLVIGDFPPSSTYASQLGHSHRRSPSSQCIGGKRKKSPPPPPPPFPRPIPPMSVSQYSSARSLVRSFVHAALAISPLHLLACSAAYARREEERPCNCALLLCTMPKNMRHNCRGTREGGGGRKCREKRVGEFPLLAQDTSACPNFSAVPAQTLA